MRYLRIQYKIVTATISDDKYNFPYPVSASGIAGEEKSIWSILAF